MHLQTRTRQFEFVDRLYGSIPRSPRTGHVRFYETSRQIRNCPTGGQRRPPLQDVVRGRRKCVQFCRYAPPGRCGHRPLRRFCMVAVWLRDFVIASCAGGVEPLPYGNGGRLYGIALVHSNLPVRTAQSFRHGFAVPPPFTQGRLGAVQTRRRSRNLQKAGRASPAPTLRQILYFFLTG